MGQGPGPWPKGQGPGPAASSGSGPGSWAPICIHIIFYRENTINGDECKLLHRFKGSGRPGEASCRRSLVVLYNLKGDTEVLEDEAPPMFLKTWFQDNYSNSLNL